MSLLRDPIPVLRRKKRPAESLGREEPETAPLDASEAEALMMDESDEEEDGSDAEPTLGEPTLASLPPTSFLDRTHTPHARLAWVCFQILCALQVTPLSGQQRRRYDRRWR